VSYPKEMLERMVADQKAATIRRAKVLIKENYSDEGPRLLSMEQLEKRLVNQECKCALCEKELGMGQWVVDHCHKQGHVRGLLCRSCDSWLGKNERMVAVVAAYIAKEPIDD